MVTSWFRRHRRAAVSAVGVSVAAVTIISVATVYDGAASAQIDLNDGGVWVTKQSTLQIGHVNRPAALIDGSAYADNEQFDVLQSGEALVVTGAGSLSTLDPVTYTLGSQVALPPEADVRLGGDTLAVLDRDGGDLWVMPANEAGQFSGEVKPLLTLGDGAAVAVGRDGTVRAAAPQQDAVYAVHTRDGRAGRIDTADVTLADDAAVAITAVGDTAVLLDSSTGELRTTSNVLTVLDDAADARLQEPSDAAAAVAVTFSDALLTVALDGGDVTRTETSSPGRAVVPVQVAGCVYGVWEGSAESIRDCAGSAQDSHGVIADAAPDATFRFRVNRDVVMLNDVVSGASWLADGDLRKIDNWSEARPPQEQTDDNGDSSTLGSDTALAERSAENTPPIATDDTFGVRAGRSTLLPVTDNDSDPDGDVLTVSVASPPAWGTVTPVLDGAALQIIVDAGQTGEASFTYMVDDGRGGTATATVTLAVHPDEVNAQPEQRRVQTIPLEVGGEVTYDALPDWIDPDGDDLYLQTATAGTGDAVRFTPDGRVTFTSATGVTGLVEVQLVVSDGRLTRVGVLRFDVRGTGETAPATMPDHVVFRAGESASVRPLKNDVSGSKTPLRLSTVGEAAGLSIAGDMDAGVITFASDTVGTYYVIYVATAGGEPAPGVVRVDVTAASAPAAPPIAVRDIAMLSAGGDIVVRVLDNDVDPAGGVLVVQGVAADLTGAVSASVVSNDRVRITAPGGLSGPSRLSYRVSNGASSATGDIIVIPIAPSTMQLPPVAVADALIVRADDVGTVDVLSNDTSPVGAKLTLVPDLVGPLDATVGEAFVSNGQLRVRAGSAPGSGIVTYQVVDDTGQTATAQVTVTVLAVGDTNAPPQPREIDVRTIAGTGTTVTINLDGIDPDGDSVELVSLETAPGQGIVGDMGDRSFNYRAEATAAGTDVFRYRVRDRLGAEAVGVVRIGIAPREAVNQPPSAVTDRVSVRPGREVDVAVLANDEDPDGDSRSLVADALTMPDIDGFTARTAGDVVVVTAPETPGLYSFQYVVADVRGASAVGTVQVLVDPTVPLQAPIATDDRVHTSTIGDDGVAIVDVLSNDVDPDGTRDGLELALAAGVDTASVTADRTVSVQVTTERQLLEYTVTDADGQAGRAFIFVPALADLRPVLIDGGGVVRVTSGQPATIALADHVRIVGGGVPVLDDRRTPGALHTDGTSLAAGPDTLTYTSAAGFVGTDALTFGVQSAGEPDTATVLSITVIVSATGGAEGGTAPQTDDPTVPGAEPTVSPTDDPNAPVVATLTFSGTSLTAVPGDPAVTQSLRALTAAPTTTNLDDVTYEVTDSTLPTGVSATIGAQTLSVSAARGATVGGTGTITVQASGGGETASATMSVSVVATVLPRAVATTDTAETKAGQAVTVDVTRNDVNPYAGTAELTVTDARVTAGDAQLTRSGTEVTITPAAGSTGQVTASYRIADASGDASRDVEGLIIVRITGERPGAPGTPQIGAVASQTVDLSWTAPTSNGGSAIIAYTVRDQNQRVVATCTAPACRVNGLTNDTAYRFTVTATNSVGESPASAQSAEATPADRPNPPPGITGSTSDSTVLVSWTAPPRATSYEVEISPTAPDGSTVRSTTSTSLSWGGLTNGTAYAFRIRALAGSLASDWTAWSASFTPSRVPDSPSAPVATRMGGDGSVNTFSVAWSPPGKDGGSPVTSYTLRMYGGAGTRTFTVTGTSYTVTSAAGDDSVSFDVAATNLRGSSPYSARSAAAAVVRAPGEPGRPSVTAGNGIVTVTGFTPAAPNGADPRDVSYLYSLADGPWTPLPASGQIPAANGVATRVSLRAITTIGGNTASGVPSLYSAWVTPTAPVAQLTPPDVTATPGPGKVTFTWSHPDAAAQNVTAVEYTLGGVWLSKAVNGSIVYTADPGTEVVILVRAVSGDGTRSAEVRAAATTQ